MPSAQIPAVSTEYVHVPVTATVVLDAQPVELAFLTTNAAPDGNTPWIAADWTGAPATARTARVLVGPATSVPLNTGTITIWVRVSDQPEVPVRNAGQLKVI